MASELLFHNQVVVVTGAGGGLGRAYALYYARCGAKVVVNDLGGGLNGDGSQTTIMADKVVEEIKAAGGDAVADHHDVADGDKIIQTAISTFGAIHVLINNAGILRDVSFKRITDEDWNIVQRVHMYGSYKTTRAAWPYMQKQKFGRIVCTSSGAGVYGSFGQTNYSAAKAGLIGFVKALAKEGQPYNIQVNIINPAAASRLTQTVMTPELLARLSPEWVVPIVAAMTYKDSKESGSILDAGAAVATKFRWERSRPVVLKTQIPSLSAISAVWGNVSDFSNSSYPDDLPYSAALPEGARIISPTSQQDHKDMFAGKVAIVIGAGEGLGQQYAVLLASLGAKVVVNCVSNADAVVKQIKLVGGEAVADSHPSEEGAAIVNTAVDAFGTVHIIINNVCRPFDRQFHEMTDENWIKSYNGVTYGPYAVTKAAWPHMLKNKYGRIVNTTSAFGLYGHEGRSGYSAGTMAIVGFSRALFREGQRYGIQINTVAPSTDTLASPERVAPFVAFLSSDSHSSNGGVYEIGPAWISRLRWQRSQGYSFPSNRHLTSKEVYNKWQDIVQYNHGADNPDSAEEGMARLLANVGGSSYNSIQKTKAAEKSINPIRTALDRVEEAKRRTWGGCKYNFDTKDVILYNLSIGARVDDLQWTYEGASNFKALPSFGLIPQMHAATLIDFKEIFPNYSLTNLLHAGQHLKIRRLPIPTSGSFTSSPRLLEVLDKESAAVATIGISTVEDATGNEIFYNESTIFLRNCGGFGGARSTSLKSPEVSRPTSKPVYSIDEQTSALQTALYRLNGDLNPLHIDPAVASAAGFQQPILHGLCSLSISSKHVLDRFGPLQSVGGKFVGSVIPTQTLRTDMWTDDTPQPTKVFFQTTIVETGKVAIADGVAELSSLEKSRL